MKTPNPFEPDWSIFSGGGIERGKGLLGRPTKGIIQFVVCLGHMNVCALQGMGHILFDGYLKAAAEPGPLLWFRRMGFQMGSQDKNETCTPDCLYYGLGFGDKVLVKIYRDERVELVL